MGACWLRPVECTPRGLRRCPAVPAHGAARTRQWHAARRARPRRHGGRGAPGRPLARDLRPARRAGQRSAHGAGRRRLHRLAGPGRVDDAPRGRGIRRRGRSSARYASLQVHHRRYALDSRSHEPAGHGRRQRRKQLGALPRCRGVVRSVAGAARRRPGGGQCLPPRPAPACGPGAHLGHLARPRAHAARRRAVGGNSLEIRAVDRWFAHDPHGRPWAVRCLGGNPPRHGGRANRVHVHCKGWSVCRE